jgi:signal transduction histidine kinase
MLKVLQEAIDRLSFSRQFLLAIIAVLTVGMLVIGSWIGHLIETNAVNRTAAISAVYLESMSAAQLHEWPRGGALDSEAHNELDRIFVEGPLHREVLRFKLWDASGRIDYSNDHAQIGHIFPVSGLLAAAFAGKVQSHISDLDEIDNLPELINWNQLLEIYVPIRSTTDGRVFAVAEFYLSVDKLKHDILAAQERSWALVALSTFAVYLLLYSLVRRASNTIDVQQRDLRKQLKQLHSALDENDRMREQLREAGESTTALNEEFLLRIAADLHDGPAQTIAFALMRFDEFANSGQGSATSAGEANQELSSIQKALQSSLRDVRKISSGLTIPGMTEMSLADTARRAIHDFERLSGQTVQAKIDEIPDKVPLAIKITVYRLLQESLNNCWRHAPGGSPQVLVQKHEKEVLVTISDHGAGFDTHKAFVGGRLGLNFMRERVRLLGGIFEIDSAPGSGTSIRARLPLSTDEMIHV